MTSRHFAALAICSLLGAGGLLLFAKGGGALAWLLTAFLALGVWLQLAPRERELALVAKSVAALALILVLVAAVVFAAWESGEVVVLRYADADGSARGMRLWVIDLDGHPSVVISSAKEQLELIRAAPSLALERADTVDCRVARFVSESEAGPAERVRAESLFREKYGVRLLSTRLLGFFLAIAPEAAEPVLVQLMPCPEDRG